MKTQRFVLTLVIIVLILIGGFFAFNIYEMTSGKFAFIGGIGEVELKPLALNQEDISNITKPAIVRIYHHVEGKTIIPFFDIDWNNLDIIFPRTKEPLELPLDEYFSGSGFIVNRDGYVVTNAHVVSDFFVKRSIAQQLIALRFLALLQSPKDLQQLDKILKTKGINTADAQQFGEKLALNLGDKLAEKITAAYSNKIVVLNPSSMGDKISDLVAKGFPAKIVDLHENFFKDEIDIAILKINVANLPTVNLGDSNTIGTGNKIYVFGFPSSGQFNPSDILEPTFTQGTVNGIKDSKTKTFKVFQTDAKVSTGSSGGPVFNSAGEAVGIVTFATSAKDVGDAFAFAIPIYLVRDMLNGKNIAVKESIFVKSLKGGLLHSQNNRCQKAIQDFNAVKQTNKDFPVDKYIRSYVDKCNALISSGQSIDTVFAEFKVWAGNLGNLFWILFAIGIIIILIIGLVVIKLIKRVRKDEEEIMELEHESAVGMRHIPESFAGHQPEIINPAVLNYVQTARNTGMSDIAIEDELRKSGWSEDIIQIAMKK